MNELVWLGHATVVVDLDGTRVVTDPVLRARVAHLRRAGAPPARLQDVDAVLVSHAHYDHLDIASLRRLGQATRVVVPDGAGRLLRRRGFTDVVEVEAGETVELGSLHVDVVPAEHDAQRRPFGLRAEPVGYVLRGSQSVYFAGDTDFFDGMRELGPVDWALLPVAGWGRTLPAGHLSPRRAAEALALLRPRVAVPIHWGTFREPFARPGTDEPAREFAAAAAELAPDVDVRVLEPGGRCPLEFIRSG